MKKFLVILLSLVLAATMAIGLTACEPDDGPGEPIDVAGVYTIDLSASGMPLTVYLQIKEDGAFTFAADDSFATAKSAGTVSKPDTDYLMIFSEVNGETVTTGSKTCHFTEQEDGSLKFNGEIPYGKVTFKSPMTNDDGKEVIFYAIPYMGGGTTENENTVEPGIYYGEYTTGEGEMGTVYSYYLTIREDGKFTALVTFSAMGNDCIGYDYGTYSSMGSACRMTSAVYDDKETQDDLTEALTVDEDGVYTADVRTSRMASDTVKFEVKKLTASPTEVIASYEGEHTVSMGPTMSMSFELTLDIYADGSYKFTAATDGEDPSVETGFLGIENMISKAGILLPDGMETPGDITLDAEGALHGKFSMGAGSRQDVTLTPVAA